MPIQYREVEGGGPQPVQYNILNKGFRNVSSGGPVTAFQFQVVSGYYRGVWLPLVEGFEVTVDGETFTRAQTKCSFGGKTYAQDELEKLPNARWQWDEPAVLIVSKPGGLKPGMHDIQVVVKIRVSYMPVQPSVYKFAAKVPLVAA